MKLIIYCCLVCVLFAGLLTTSEAQFVEMVEEHSAVPLPDTILMDYSEIDDLKFRLLNNRPNTSYEYFFERTVLCGSNPFVDEQLCYGGACLLIKHAQTIYHASVVDEIVGSGYESVSYSFRIDSTMDNFINTYLLKVVDAANNRILDEIVVKLVEGEVANCDGFSAFVRPASLAEEIKIYPTYSNRIFKVEFPERIISCEFKVFNLNGQSILSRNILANEEMEMDFSPGLYFANIQFGKQVYTRKFIIR